MRDIALLLIEMQTKVDRTPQGLQTSIHRAPSAPGSRKDDMAVSIT